MTLSEDKTKVICMYCGSTELINESDAVKIQKIKSKAYTDVELGKQQLENKMLDHQIAKENNMAALRRMSMMAANPVCIALIILAMISLFCGLLFLREGITIFPGIIGLVQAAVFGFGWLVGMKFINIKMKNLEILLLVIGIALAIPVIVEILIQELPYGGIDITWSSVQLNEELPPPDKLYGKVLVNTGKELDMYVHKATREDYNNYINKVEEFGYTIEVLKEGDSYSSFNEQGYRLKLKYVDSSERLNINLTAPLKLKPYIWPVKGIATTLPQPTSTIGLITEDSSDKFTIYIGDMTHDQFYEYTTLCQTNGYGVIYERTENSYYGVNSQGMELTISYEGFNTVLISLLDN